MNSPTADELAEEMYKEIQKLPDNEQQDIRQAFATLARPTLLTEDADLVPDMSLCTKREKAMKRRMGPRREASKVVSEFRKLQRKQIKDKAYAEDPSPYDADHLFCVLHT